MNHQSVEFRQALGSFATGVTVVTAAGAEGAMAGVTANSFTSVSLEPPLILWCLANTSDSLPVFRDAAYFAVNILASGQVRLSDHFARRQEDKFSEVSFRRGRGGAPLLDGCVTWLQCRTAAQYDMGDHRVFVGEVVGFESNWEEALLFHRGSYGISLPLPGDETRQISPAEAGRYGGEDLYSLLVQAIHAYQEKFEARQNRLVKSSYEARVLLLLRRHCQIEIRELGRKIQVPQAEMEDILTELAEQDLININEENDRRLVALGREGAVRAEELWKLARQHEADALALLHNGDATRFRDNLVQLIYWDRR